MNKLLLLLYFCSTFVHENTQFCLQPHISGYEAERPRSWRAWGSFRRIWRGYNVSALLPHTQNDIFWIYLLVSVTHTHLLHVLYPLSFSVWSLNALLFYSLTPKKDNICWMVCMIFLNTRMHVAFDFAWCYRPGALMANVHIYLFSPNNEIVYRYLLQPA